MKTTNLPPSYFSALGVSCCSNFGKMELELFAWAYVTTQARDGDTWHTVTIEQCRELLTEEELHETVGYMLPCKGETDWGLAPWWEMLGERLTSADGAFDIGGLTWARWRYEKTFRQQPE